MSGQAWPRLTNSPLAYKKQNYSVLTLNLGHNLITRILTATVLYKKILLVHFSPILIFFFFSKTMKNFLLNHFGFFWPTLSKREFSQKSVCQFLAFKVPWYHKNQENLTWQFSQKLQAGGRIDNQIDGTIP